MTTFTVDVMFVISAEDECGAKEKIAEFLKDNSLTRNYYIHKPKKGGNW